MEDSIIAQGEIGTIKTLTNNVIRVNVDFNGDDETTRNLVMKYFSRLGQPVAIALLNSETLSNTNITKSTFGEQAKVLRLSTFFRSPKVWEKIGSDEDYLKWLRERKCAVINCREFTPPSEAAHVRRIASGAGVGIKPPYSAIPLCHYHHSLQHQSGESAIGGSDHLDRLRIDYLQTWGWERLKTILGYQHWNEVPPDVLKRWAETNDLSNYLPIDYS